MIDLNAYQALIYRSLKEIAFDSNVQIYDKIPANAIMPFVVIGGYVFGYGETKDYSCFSIEQKFEIWSDYQGKKEVNDIMMKVYAKLSELEGVELSESQSLDFVELLPSNVDEVENYFNANLFVNFQIL